MRTSIDRSAHPVNADAVRGFLPHLPRVLALGEPTHGEDALLELRNDLFMDLIDAGHYRTIAIESDALRALIVDDYVAGVDSDIDHVMRNGFSHGFGTSPANRDLVRRLRDHNAGRPAAEQIRFAGLDGPVEMESAACPREVLLALHADVEEVATESMPCTARELEALLGEDEQWTDPRIMFDPSRSIGRTAAAVRLRVLVDDLMAVMESVAPALQVRSREGWSRTRLYARSAAGLLRYHHAMADTSSNRFGALLSRRSAMMAANLLALAEQEPVLAFAHNAHLQRPRSSMTMGDQEPQWWSAGAIVGAHLSDDYRFIATALGTIDRRGVPTPSVGTLERIMFDGPYDRALFDSRCLANIVDGRPPTRRESPWFGYAPIDPEHLPYIDGIAFLRHVGSGG